MEYTVFKRKAPKTVSSTLHADTPHDALEVATSISNWDKAFFSVVRTTDYLEFLQGQITKQELQSIAQELRHKPESKVDVLQLLKQINDCLHEWDNGREGEMRAQEWWNVRQTIQEAGYDIHEVAIWDSEGDMIIRRDLAIAPRMEAS